MGRSCEELAWRVEQARQHQITFSVEAHVGSIVPNAKIGAASSRRGSWPDLTLDYTHFTRSGLPDRAAEPS